MDRTRWNVWRSLTTGTVILAALGVLERHGALAQLAPPSGRPTGILGVQDHRVQSLSDKWPWSAVVARDRTPRWTTLMWRKTMSPGPLPRIGSSQLAGLVLYPEPTEEVRHVPIGCRLTLNQLE